MASLNQMVSNNYLRANLSAKRQRPPSDPPEEPGIVPASASSADAAQVPASAVAAPTSTPTPVAPNAPVAAKPPPAKKFRASSAAGNNGNNVEGEITDAILAAAAKRHAAPEFLQPRPAARLADLAGIDAITAQVCVTGRWVGPRGSTYRQPLIPFALDALTSPLLMSLPRPPPHPGPLPHPQVQELVFYPVRYPELYR